MPILHWLNREESISAATHVPYRLLEADTVIPPEIRGSFE